MGFRVGMEVIVVCAVGSWDFDLSSRWRVYHDDTGVEETAAESERRGGEGDLSALFVFCPVEKGMEVM